MQDELHRKKAEEESDEVGDDILCQDSSRTTHLQVDNQLSRRVRKGELACHMKSLNVMIGPAMYSGAYNVYVK